MSKMNIRITETNGTQTLLTGATSGQVKAIRDALDTIYQGAIISVEPQGAKVARVPVNTALAKAGYTRFGDPMTPAQHAKALQKLNEADEGAQGDVSDDEDETNEDETTDVDISFTQPAFGQSANLV